MVSGDAQGFGWDAVGNRTNHSRAGLSYAIGLDPLANRNFTLSGSTSRSFGYDAAGNLASDARPDGTRTFGYDSFNRLGGFYFNGALASDYWVARCLRPVWPASSRKPRSVADLLPARKMKLIPIALAAVAITALAGGCTATEGGNMAQAPISPALTVRLTDQELPALKGLASGGDCRAALRVARHYSFVLNDFDEAISWLRLAAKCPAPEPKAELVYLLLGTKARSVVAEEIESLIVEIRATNPDLADEVRKEVQIKLGKTSGG